MSNRKYVNKNYALAKLAGFASEIRVEQGTSPQFIRQHVAVLPKGTVHVGEIADYDNPPCEIRYCRNFWIRCGRPSRTTTLNHAIFFLFRGEGVETCLGRVLHAKLRVDDSQCWRPAAIIRWGNVGEKFTCQEGIHMVREFLAYHLPGPVLLDWFQDRLSGVKTC